MHLGAPPPCPYASQIAYNGRGSITNWHAPNDRNTHIAYADRGWPASMEVVANFVLPTAPTKPTAPVAPIAPTRPANPTVANPGAQPVAPAQPATAKPGAGITGDTACRKAYRAPFWRTTTIMRLPGCSRIPLSGRRKLLPAPRTGITTVPIGATVTQAAARRTPSPS